MGSSKQRQDSPHRARPNKATENWRNALPPFDVASQRCYRRDMLLHVRTRRSASLRGQLRFDSSRHISWLGAETLLQQKIALEE